MSWFRKLFGSPAAAPSPALAPEPEPLRFRVEEAEPLRGSPAGTRAMIARLGNAGQEARFRLELSPSLSQVSEEFAFAGGGFWREPAPASMIQAFCAAFHAGSPQSTMRMSKLPFAVERITAQGGWFQVTLKLQESKALLEMRYSLREAQGEIRLLEKEKAQAVVDELAQIL
jgi:hypothetical protein